MSEHKIAKAFEVSAKNATNVQNTFIEITRILRGGGKGKVVTKAQPKSKPKPKV